MQSTEAGYPVSNQHTKCQGFLSFPISVDVPSQNELSLSIIVTSIKSELMVEVIFY